MVTAPAAPTLAELMESLPEINPLNYNDDDVRCLNDWAISVWQAYRSGKLREVGDGEVVVPRIALLDAVAWLSVAADSGIEPNYSDGVRSENGKAIDELLVRLKSMLATKDAP